MNTATYLTSSALAWGERSVTEAADSHNRLYGIDRLCTVISQHWAGTAQDIQAAVIADVRCHIGAQKVFDDITLVVAKQR